MDLTPIVDPSGTAAERAGFAGVPRPTSLDGLRLGILDNGKPNAQHVVATAARGISERIGLSDVMAVTKPVASRPVADEALVRFKGFDAAIVGVGD